MALASSIDVLLRAMRILRATTQGARKQQPGCRGARRASPFDLHLVFSCCDYSTRREWTGYVVSTG
ncbi:MAG TPA: hypothetical protein VM406_16000 [Noviherbaspirillum sp.]|nr:hypothetical protein [Noviherbaspirillum sp.]